MPPDPLAIILVKIVFIQPVRQFVDIAAVHFQLVVEIALHFCESVHSCIYFIVILVNLIV